jgi:hypothetical protein
MYVQIFKNGTEKENFPELYQNLIALADVSRQVEV